MGPDLSDILNNWPFEAGKLSVRLIDGADNEPRLQVRLDLGILQMQLDGRPDGLEPEGFGSLLEYFEARYDEVQLSSDSSEYLSEEIEAEEFGAEQTASFSLSPEDCASLREEAVQFYHRYIALLAIEDYDRVTRDTTRNLRLLDFVRAHAQTEHDRETLEQYRPYITMVRARALAGKAFEEEEPKAAIHAIDEGIEALRRYYADSGQGDLFEQSTEVQMLRGMREALVPKLPVSQRSELKKRLDDALQQENYELAAILRDELRLIKDSGDSAKA